MDLALIINFARHDTPTTVQVNDVQREHRSDAELARESCCQSYNQSYCKSYFWGDEYLKPCERYEIARHVAVCKVDEDEEQDTRQDESRSRKKTHSRHHSGAICAFQTLSYSHETNRCSLKAVNYLHWRAE
jgi:hypothetical protein